MGCGIADFGRRGLKTPQTQKIEFQFCPLAPQVEVQGAASRDPWGVWGVYRPYRPKSAVPHPITIQNMRFER